MPYNHIQLEKFVEKVNEEAEKAAQAVFDKYEAEFIQRVESQLLSGDTVNTAMGTAWFDNKDIDTQLLVVITDATHYQKQHANFKTLTFSKP